MLLLLGHPIKLVLNRHFLRQLLAHLALEVVEALLNFLYLVKGVGREPLMDHLECVAD